MADGARLTPRWIKQVAPWPDASVDANGLAVQPQKHGDLAAKEWHDLWKVGRANQIDFGGVNSAPVVPSPPPDDLRDVCGSFSAHTHWFQQPPEARLQCLQRPCGHVTKATGGWRPIGLFTSVLRVYLRWTRRAVTSSWERGFSRGHLFGQTAHTRQDARRLSMAGECATSVGFSAASALSDFAQAFEYIQFSYL